MPDSEQAQQVFTNFKCALKTCSKLAIKAL